jgi:hypothetical protein
MWVRTSRRPKGGGLRERRHESADFPATAGAYNGGTDAFAVKIPLTWVPLPWVRHGLRAAPS